MNLPRARVSPPQRSKWFSVWRTHESGDSEMRQRVVMTRRPYRRREVPGGIPDHGSSEGHAEDAGAESVPSAASAPATISVGIAGSGTPSCSSSTLAKIQRQSMPRDQLEHELQLLQPRHHFARENSMFFRVSSAGSVPNWHSTSRLPKRMSFQ